VSVCDPMVCISVLVCILGLGVLLSDQAENVDVLVFHLGEVRELGVGVMVKYV
jgi:hypothetical protein